MFKPHYGQCLGPCRKDGQLIPVKDGFCQKCNYERKQNKKKAAGKSVKKYAYVPEATGEGRMMEDIVLGLTDEATCCLVCKKPIAVFMYGNMAHVLSKKQYPEYRLYKKNIAILCFNLDGDNCHHKYDHTAHSNLVGEGWKKLFEIAEQLKQQYPKII